MRFPLIALLALLSLPSPRVEAQLSMVQPIPVAESIAAKKGVTGPASGVIVFDGPHGDGRRGTKGLLWKSDPAETRSGTSWSFRYARGGAAQTLQIIHPLGRGQAIVHLNTNSIGLSTPKLWKEVGYGNGPSDKVKETKAFREIFPLVEGKEYNVVSRLSPGGALDLFIDGKQVASGHASSPDPLSLKNTPDKGPSLAGSGDSEFKGANLPLIWMPGWGGLIVGPIDSGVNRCSEIRFYHGLFNPTAGKF